MATPFPAIEALSKGASDQLAGLLQDLLARRISLEQWELSVAATIKDAHIANGIFGAGGVENVTQSMYGEIGSRIKQEYNYLHGFTQEIADGKLSEAQIAARLNMYANDAYGSYADTERALNMGNGMTEERAILSGDAAHCEDCIARAALGWQPIGTLDDIGDTQCGSNDRCYFEYQ